MKTLPHQFAYQSHTLTLVRRTQTVGIAQKGVWMATCERGKSKAEVRLAAAIAAFDHLIYK
jgi:CO/xanthine dehydrogenase FAD-binding subunit